jgi:hypothetical protein
MHRVRHELNTRILHCTCHKISLRPWRRGRTLRHRTAAWCS